MNQIINKGRFGALEQPVDVLLADVAIRVQLSRTDHNKAVDRYQTLNDWLDREGSPLKDRVRLMYCQGSMRIGATIAAKLRTDEFDIDIVAELDLPGAITPKAALDLLYAAIRGEPGSRYYKMAERRNRCVTVHYADDMHLDLTPALLGAPASAASRPCVIFHHKPEEQSQGYKLWADPWGFAEWFKGKTPTNQDFAEAFAKQADAWEASMAAMRAAEAVPVPAQQSPHLKSIAVIVLQLIKRWRNVRYDKRKGMRRPPSVMLAKLIADAAQPNRTLSEELLVQARHLHAVIGAAHQRGELVHVGNPSWPQDVLTDRWPASLDEQRVFLVDLVDLIGKVERLRGDCDLEEMRIIMTDLFGETPTGDVFKSFVERLGKGIAGGTGFHVPGAGRIDLPRAGIIGAAVATPARAATPTPRHTFFGRPRG